MDGDMSWDIDDIINYNRGYWETKDGRNLKIELMETSHIKNCINLLKRNLQKLDEDELDYYSDYFDFKINEFEKELKKRDVYKRHVLGD
jgi:predicted HTH domain antitoxin